MMRSVSAGVALAALLAAMPAAAQDDRVGGGRGRKVTVAPYIELSQVLTADVQSGDVLTYSSVAAGVDASVETRRVSVNLSARYEHQFAWDKNSGDADVVTGLANAQVRVTRGLSLDAGGIATRSRNDIRGAAPVFFGNDRDNVSSEKYQKDAKDAEARFRKILDACKKSSPSFAKLMEQIDNPDDKKHHYRVIVTTSGRYLDIASGPGEVTVNVSNLEALPDPVAGGKLPKTPKAPPKKPGKKSSGPSIAPETTVWWMTRWWSMKCR